MLSNQLRGELLFYQENYDMFELVTELVCTANIFYAKDIEAVAFLLGY